MRLGENCSTSGNCSARGGNEKKILKNRNLSHDVSQGLAKIAAAMANGGSLDGVEVLGSKGWQALHAIPTKGCLGKGIWEVIYITQVP